MTPQVRQWLYTISAIASAFIPLLVTYKVFDASTAAGWSGVVGALGALGTAGSGTAAVVVAKQRKEGTLDYTGTAAEQAVAAVQATVDNAASSAADLQKVKGAVTAVLSSADTVADAVAPGSLVDQLLDTVKAQP
jgi:hypothetical protein